LDRRGPVCKSSIRFSASNAAAETVATISTFAANQVASAAVATFSANVHSVHPEIASMALFVTNVAAAILNALDPIIKFNLLLCWNLKYDLPKLTSSP
jgi:hypothetical protein